ncbi:TonB-dependent receptor [Phenylobacterium sp. 20VBR1]|uniref:TonB-dependent receptor n=1 Tax=Phenylobacterium glaciei TaxID=2803784 RepID=A0A941D5Q8_9CAUL|nr:TonB-dependent receptor [Phenylobacterium glaciei]MBR7620648.1 TonB-dependent receptor [Phenylobacterium glaciei]
MQSSPARSRTRKSVWLAGSALVIGLVSGVPAWAADAEAGSVKIDPENADYGTRVEELVVTGAYLSTAAAPVKASLEATQPQSIIDRQAIDQFIPTTADYTQVVNLSPSVSGTSFNGPGLGEAKSTLRGFKDGEYNITYDGIPWGDANGPTHHSTSFFPSSTIGAVVVDRGPGAASQLGVASFGGSINLFSPEVSLDRGGSQLVTLGSWNTFLAVTKLNTGEIEQLNGARALFNFQELKTDGYLSYAAARADNQLVRAVFPIAGSWKLTVLGTWNYTKVHTNDNSGATLDQVALFGKNFALNNDPSTPNFYGYNLVTKHTYFNYAKLTGDVTPSLKLENTIYSYYYKNNTESALDPTLSPSDIAAKKGLQITQVPGGKPVVNGHIPGYTKLNVYKIYGDILHLDQTVPFGTIKAGVWWERAETGPRARYDYDATLGRTASGWTVDYRQKVLAGVPQYVEYLQYSGWDQVEPFIDVEWNVTPQLTVTPGLKYVSEKLSVDADINQKSRLPFHGSKTFTKTLYFLTANYKLQDNLALYGQYATGFLLPDISATQAVNPNLNDLEPQESTNYQAGLVYHGGKLTVDADAYYIDFTNKIQSVTVGTENVSFNLGGARYKGIEGAVTYAATDTLFVFANGSINSAEAQGASTTIGGVPVVIAGGKQIAGAPKSTAALGVLFRNDDWSISLSDKYTGEQWAAEGEPAAYRIDPYHSADLSVVYRFGAYRLEGAIYNLFDSQQATSIKPGKTVPYDQYYFQPERNAQVSVKVNF